MPKKAPAPRLRTIPESEMNAQQLALLADIQKTRGKGPLGGPFGVLLHAPAYGDLAQKLGAHCRYKTALPARLSEFTILAIARFWRSQYEWWVHSPIAEKAGVKAETIKALRGGRLPKSLPKDERAIFDFIAELHRSKRVSDKTYRRIHALFGDAGTIEFVGIVGYYTTIAMTLNVFHVPLPDGQPLPFTEPS